jgi:LmbE family N-acetylglucosaminyl deacetylase
MHWKPATLDFSSPRPMGEHAYPKPARTCYRAIFISPHLDDAVFSSGGRIAQLATEGPVLVVNLFTRYLADIKIHGAVMGAERHQEEQAAAAFLGFESLNLDELDAPFRRETYHKLGNLFRPPVAADMEWLPSLRARLFDMLSGIDVEQLYVPLGIGWHVDHVLTHQVFDTWAKRDKLLYYEDAPYCSIPHATRYRLDDLATYPSERNDISLEPSHASQAWWQAARAYADTALMKNLQPWIVRQCAVPAVGFYLWRLMAHHRRLARNAEKRALNPVVTPITDQFEHKVTAMALYRSQFGEFFASRQDCVVSLASCSQAMGLDEEVVERYWVDATA